MDLLDAFFAAVVIFVITMIALGKQPRATKKDCACRICSGLRPGVPPQEGEK